MTVEYVSTVQQASEPGHRAATPEGWGRNFSKLTGRSLLRPPRPAVHFGSLHSQSPSENPTLRSSSYEGIGPNTWLGFPSTLYFFYPGVSILGIKIKVPIKDSLFKRRKGVKLN